MADQTTVTSLVDFVCPFCGKRASATKDADGTPGVVHEMPGCANFEEMEPDEFLHAVNQRLQN